MRRIVHNEPVSPWLIELLDGSPIEADAVIVTTEAHAAARLLDTQDAALALQLRAIPYASSLIVNIAYRRDQISHPLDGFGAVVPAIEGRSILAVSFLSVKFPNRRPAGSVLLRVFLGGVTNRDQFELDDGAVSAAGSTRAGRLDWRDRHAPLRGASAVMLGRCLSTISDTSTASPPSAASSPSTTDLYLTGIAYDGVGIPDCIHAAELTAESLIDALANPAASAA